MHITTPFEENELPQENISICVAFGTHDLTNVEIVRTGNAYLAICEQLIFLRNRSVPPQASVDLPWTGEGQWADARRSLSSPLLARLSASLSESLRKSNFKQGCTEPRLFSKKPWGKRTRLFFAARVFWSRRLFFAKRGYAISRKKRKCKEKSHNLSPTY